MSEVNAKIAPTICPICGGPIPERPRGQRHGSPPKTCSEACRRERKRRVEADRYSRIRDTEHFKQRQADYRAKLKKLLASDPEFAEIFRARERDRLRAWRERLRKEAPGRHEAIKAEKRAQAAAWRAALMSDPAAWEAHKAKCRAWYASLSEEDRRRIFKRPARTARG